MAARVDGREHGPGHPEEGQEFVVPIEGLEVHEHGAAGIGDVRGVDTAVGTAREVPDHPGVGCAEKGVAALGGLTQPVDVLEQPLQLATGEVGGRGEPGLVPNGVAVAVPLQRAGDGVRAGVLPDDGVVEGAAGAGVPHDGRLALVGDADGGQVDRLKAGGGQGRADDGLGALPDLQGVVLHPAGARQDLLVLELVTTHLAPVVVEDHEPRARGPLVDRADEVRHGPSLGGPMTLLMAAVALSRKVRGVCRWGATVVRRRSHGSVIDQVRRRCHRVCRACPDRVLGRVR
ncbi:hypothetical protein BN10_1070019 [Phycicoccus elongatus Lp2]|uniref:Uncharacterized protein n=1 Tax=Phycicoccus elongatus Lp2 TaxID=1193181 RepID=N0E0Y2_9MICO|nr:hypothetical protein BN10_1070019 [Phycicoccus elongatus Lp2]